VTSKRVPTVVALAIAALLLLASGCAAGDRAQDVETGSRSIALAGAESVRADIQIETGLLEVKGGAGGVLDASWTYGAAARKPQVTYGVTGSEGRLVVRQPEKSRLLLGRDYNQWALRLNSQVPIDLNVELGSGIHSLKLGDLALARAEVTMAAPSATAIDLTGYWPHDVDMYVRGRSGSLSLALPRGTGVRVEVTGGSGSVDGGPLTREGNVYVNDAYGRSGATLRVFVDPGQAEVSLESGIPGDKSIADALLAAQMLFSAETWNCTSEPSDRQQGASDTVRDLWFDYLCERGPEHRYPDGNDQLTVELARSALLDRVRREFYTSGEQPATSTLAFNGGEFVSATGDVLVHFKDTEDLEFSITHFMGSFEYTAQREGDRLRVTVHNQTDRASGTRFPLRFPQDGYTQDLETLVEQDPAAAQAYVLEVIRSAGYPVASILKPKTREETLAAAGEGGGVFEQTFTWAERRLPHGAGLPPWPVYLPELDVR
jgi:hypothetical protein